MTPSISLASIHDAMVEKFRQSDQTNREWEGAPMNQRLGKCARIVSLGLSLCSFDTHAQTDTTKDYPNKPIRILDGATAGGSLDAITRAIAQKLTDAWGRQVVVDNRPGASGAISVDLTAKAAPD